MKLLISCEQIIQISLNFLPRIHKGWHGFVSKFQKKNGTLIFGTVFKKCEFCVQFDLIKTSLSPNLCDFIIKSLFKAFLDIRNESLII